MITNSKYITIPPKKKLFFSKIYFSIMKKLVRTEWYIRANISYYYRLLFKNNFLKKNNICILFPSKNRPEKLGRLLNSVIHKTKFKDRIKILISLDEDEKKKKKL